MSAFAVPADSPGLTVGKPEKKMGIRGSHTTDLFFENVRIPKDNLLGAPGEGFKIAMRTLDVGRVSLAAVCLGLAKEALHLSVKYSKERSQFGAPIASQQAIQFMLADMAAQVYALEAITKRTAWMCDAGKPYSKESAICKLMASEILGRIVDSAVQIHGGLGYMAEYPIERFYRDARITRIFEGTNEIQRVVIAASLLRE